MKIIPDQTKSYAHASVALDKSNQMKAATPHTAKWIISTAYKAQECTDFRDLFQSAYQLIYFMQHNEKYRNSRIIHKRLLSYVKRFKACAKCRKEKDINDMLHSEHFHVSELTYILTCRFFGLELPKEEIDPLKKALKKAYLQTDFEKDFYKTSTNDKALVLNCVINSRSGLLGGNKAERYNLKHYKSLQGLRRQPYFRLNAFLNVDRDCINELPKFIDSVVEL